MTILELGLWQFIFWWTVMLTVGAWLWVLFADERRKLWHDKRARWLAWHWFTGGDLDTDRSLPHEGQLAPYLATRYALGLARTTCCAGFLACIYAATTPAANPRQILVAGYGGTLALTAITLIVVHVAVRGALGMWWGQPLHDALYGFCGWDEDMRWHHYLAFDRVHELGLALTVQCHPSVKMSESNVGNIVDAVQKKMGRDIEHVPDWVGRASELVFRPPVLIPDHAGFWADNPGEVTNVRRLIETSGGTKVLLGLARDGVPFWMDLDSDSPHFLISAGTGGGKSETLAGIAAQLYWWGADVYIPDLKRLSHIWARDLPGVTIEADPEAIFNLFVQLAGVIDERTRECDPLRVGDPLPDFGRIVIVVEELNSLFDELRMMWNGRKGQSPAVVALRRILFMGRFLKVHVVAGAQRFDAHATGGGAARENYAWRALAEHSPQAADMLAKDADVQPKTGEDRKGRAQVVNGADVTEIRRIHWGFDPKDRYYHGHELVAWLAGSPHRPELEVPVDAAAIDRPASDKLAESGDASVVEDQAEGMGVDPSTGGTMPGGDDDEPAETPIGDVLHTTQSNTIPVGSLGVLTEGVTGNSPGESGSYSPPQPFAHGPTRPPSTSPPLRSGVAVPPDNTPSLMEIADDGILRRTDDGQGYVTLSEIVELGIIPRSLRTVRTYSQRKWFPDIAEQGTGPYGNKYHEPAVREAWARRPRVPENQDYYRPVVYGMVKGGREVLERALSGELPGVQAKVGYTWREPGERAKEVQMRPADVVAVVDVTPVPGEELPDRAFHRAFWTDKVDKHDLKDEWFWVRPRGPVARWLREVTS